VGAAVLPTVMIGGLIAQKLIDEKQLKKAQISNKDVINFLLGEIKKYDEASKIKEDTIYQLQKQIPIYLLNPLEVLIYQGFPLIKCSSLM